MTQPGLETIRRYLAALEAFTHGDALAPFFTDDVRFHELPNRLVPEGRVRDRAALLAASAMAPQVLSAQTYVVRRAVEAGPTVALDVDWTGTLRVPLGNTPAGGVLRARLAMFVTLREGRIAEQTNFDCYQPF